MGGGTSRREFMTQTLGGAAAMSSARLSAATSLASRHPAGAAEASTSPKIFLQPFDYEGVTLLDGPIKSQFDAMRGYYYAIPDDDILKGFRARAGQRARGNDLGGWYSGEPARRFWWSNGDTFNAFGQWLSGMSRMSKATGDAEMRSKAVFLMGEWASTIEPDGWFFYSRRPWQPHYIYDKQVGGLVDMAVYGGRKDALVHLSKITDWAVENLDRSRKVDSDTEWYTLSENLYRAYQVTGDEKYRRFAELWRFEEYWNAFSGAAPTQVKRHGHHAYSHVNTMSSCAMAHVVTGEKKYLDAILAEYDWLQATQCYASGGYGPEEELVAEGELGGWLEKTAFSFETTCGAWGGFKLARYLLMLTGDARYGDWIEKLLFNGSLAALPMGPKGATFYYSDYRLGGGRKFYHPDGNWPCCSGTYPQVLADYHNVVYFRDAGGLAVNLFVPSRVSWNQAGTLVTVEQETAFPDSDTTTLTVRPGKPASFDVKFRVPAWTQGVEAAVNGKPFALPSAAPGTWAVLRRTWSPGDRVTLRLPMRLALSPIDAQHPKRVAVTFGPVVLVRDATPRLALQGGPTEWMVGRPGLEFAAPGQPEGLFMPFYKVGANMPYDMYFDLQS